jgi:hypothetical protein
MGVELLVGIIRVNKRPGSEIPTKAKNIGVSAAKAFALLPHPPLLMSRHLVIDVS